ncbi:MAG TPA: PQQ-binding-like beta-propeller repeat protein [Myxococcales bacterium]
MRPPRSSARRCVAFLLLAAVAAAGCRAAAPVVPEVEILPPLPAPPPPPPLEATAAPPPPSRVLVPRGDPKSLEAIAYDLLLEDRIVPALPEGFAQVFPDKYTEVPGVLGFRGGPRRDFGTWGLTHLAKRKLRRAWNFKTGDGKPPWGGGSGWTGEPALVQWPDVIRHSMPLLNGYRTSRALVEVIVGSLDGHVYFLELATGKPTRKAIDTGNPIKGSVSIDPRGYPLLFVGQGIPQGRPIGMRVFSLIDHQELFFLAGRDRQALRDWGAFDSSGLLNRATDSYLQPGENGLIYLMKLHTEFDPIGPAISIKPEVMRYRYADAEQRYLGTENSAAVLRNLAFFADNGGTITALDLTTMKPAWAFESGDDVDASIVLSEEEGAPFLYTGTEVDKKGIKGDALLRKIDAMTGVPLWEHGYSCVGAAAHHASGEAKAEGNGEAANGNGEGKKIDAGLFATPLVGSGDVADRVVFTLSRCPDFERGLIVALSKKDGSELWRRPLKHYAWSSPTAVRDEDGHTFFLQGDISGALSLVDARDGTIVDTIKLDGGVESSPAVFGDMAVVGTRGGRIWGIRLE